VDVSFCRFPFVTSVRPWLGAAVLLVCAAVPALAASPAGSDLAPVPRTGARLSAVSVLSGGGAISYPCLTPILQSIRQDPQRVGSGARRAAAALSSDLGMTGERRILEADGSSVRFSLDRGSFDRLDVIDDDANGRPDAVDAAFGALGRAERLLTRQIDLPGPGGVEVVFARLGSGIDGLLTSSARDGRAQIWVDSALRGGLPGVRRTVEHQYAHAVAQAAGLDSAWGEAFAVWTTLAAEGSPDDRTSASLAHRLATLSQGLDAEDLDLAAGNAAWFAFVNEAFGSTAVKLAVEELGHAGSHAGALDRALRRSGGVTLEQALRDFQLWSLLVGPRDDRRHFSFASAMPAPEFAATADSLPALSVQADPEVAPLGAAAISFHPGERTGGLALRFEGDLTARWAADALLVRPNGSMQRVALALDADAAGDLTVPLQDVREVILLVRNLDTADHPARRYTWTAHDEPGFPAEIASLRAEAAGPSGGTLVSWETSRESGVIGFNVLRAAADGGEGTRINPVWIPAVGDPASAADYSFLDAGAARGVLYRYRIEAITAEGLSSHSEPVAAPPAD
jgi:hypothetical protein